MKALPAAALASLGLGLVLVGEQEAFDRGPSGWTVDRPLIPVYLSSLAGPARHPGQGWALGSRHLLQGPTVREALEVEAELPRGGNLSLALAPAQGEAAVLHLGRFGDARPELLRKDLADPFSPRRTELVGCQGELPALPEGRLRASLRMVEGRLEARVGEGTLTCVWRPAGETHAVLVSGLQRVGLHRLVVDGQAWPAPEPRWLLRALAALLGGLAGVGLGRSRARPRATGLVLAPLLLCAPLARLDLEAWSQQARLLVEHPIRLAVALPLLLSLLLGLGAVAAGLARRPRRGLLLSAGLLTLAAGGLVALARPAFPHSVAWAAGAGAALGALVWVNVHAARLRFFNLLSLGLVALGLVAAEDALRYTATGNRLIGVSNREGEAFTPQMAARDPRAAFEEVETTRRHRDYPSSGYPVAPPPRAGHPRIVALGSSSTGGAFQFDDLRQFWPARLERRLPGSQVVNQAVGGWTSLHARRYVETRLQDIDPDIFVVYFGNNDMKERSARPYKELLSELRGEAPQARPLGFLSRLRLYQLLRFSLSPLATRTQGAALSLDDAEENLAAIIAKGRERGARTLLVCEAVFPDPEEIAPYCARMAGLARAEDVRSLDAAALLLGAGAWSSFLDDVHLSEAGHERLAEGIEAELRASGWLSD